MKRKKRFFLIERQALVINTPDSFQEISGLNLSRIIRHQTRFRSVL